MQRFLKRAPHLLLGLLAGIQLSSCGLLDEETTTTETVTNTTTAPDTTSPSITFTVPVDGDSGTSVTGNLKVVFSEAMDNATVDNTTITLRNGSGTTLQTAVTYADQIATIDPTDNLSYSTNYSISFDRSIADVAGNTLSSLPLINFTTEASPDATAPTVSSVSPTSGATAVAVQSPLTITFNEEMELDNLTTTTITLVDNATPTPNSVTGTVTYGSGQIAIFTPSSNLATSTTYSALVLAGVEDTSGNGLSDNYTWSFTTDDAVYPMVASIVPDDGSTGIATNSDIRITFDSAMDLSTLTTATITLVDNATQNSVTGTVTYANDTTVIFTPSSTLTNGTTYAVAVSTAAQSSGGVAMQTAYSASFTTIQYNAISSVRAIATGASFSCALNNNGTAKCWGLNNNGALGDGTLVDSNNPVDVKGLTFASSITSGNQHSCALKNDRTVQCWGSNMLGQIGDGSGVSNTVPATVAGLGTDLQLEDVRDVSSGANHTCAILDNYSAACWGNNRYMQLGDNTTTNSDTPVQVLDGDSNSNFAQISAGGVEYGAHTCGLLSTGEVVCWGENNQGQLGTGSTVDNGTPQLVQDGAGNLGSIDSISAGGLHTCAVDTNGDAFCWGDNFNGQLGDGTIVDNTTAEKIPTLDTVSAISAGHYHTCALDNGTDSGYVFCWGDNRYGQLGDNTKTRRLVPTAVAGITTATAISSGDYHTCAVLADESVQCWGYNSYGQLGDNTNTDSELPVNVVDP